MTSQTETPSLPFFTFSELQMQTIKEPLRRARPSMQRRYTLSGTMGTGERLAL
ncbi:MAG: hypothetical protein OXC17_01715 [Aestuariivita sp.]|nr:hypothetical protein [Aestuariivita sp.]